MPCLPASRLTVRALTAFALLGLLLAVSCSGYFGPQRRAAAYYSHMVGLTPKTPYTAFISPAYRKQLAPEALKALNNALAQSKLATDRYPKAGLADVGVEAKGRFAWTTVNPLLGDAYANLEPVRWVKVGLGWYLYFGSDAEKKAYGDFPGDLGKPVAPREEPEPIRKAQPDQKPKPAPKFKPPQEKK